MVSLSQSGGGSVISKPELIAEIPMKVGVVYYELASVEEYREIYISIKRTYIKDNVGTGNVWLQLFDKVGGIHSYNIYMLGNLFNYTFNRFGLTVYENLAQILLNQTNNGLLPGTSGYVQYTDEYFNGDLVTGRVYRLSLTESWANTIQENDMIYVYGVKR